MQDQLEYYRNFTEDLIALIRDSDEATVQLIISTIQSGAENGNLRELLNRIGDNVDADTDPNTILYYDPNQPR
jgi:hypothetical protein